MPGSTMPSASESAIVSQLRERIAPGRKRGINHFNSKLKTRVEQKARKVWGILKGG